MVVHWLSTGSHSCCYIYVLWCRHFWCDSQRRQLDNRLWKSQLSIHRGVPVDANRESNCVRKLQHNLDMDSQPGGACICIADELSDTGQQSLYDGSLCAQAVLQFQSGLQCALLRRCRLPWRELSTVHLQWRRCRRESMRSKSRRPRSQFDLQRGHCVRGSGWPVHSLGKLHSRSDKLHPL
jgi:hypothetical protein